MKTSWFNFTVKILGCSLPILAAYLFACYSSIIAGESLILFLEKIKPYVLASSLLMGLTGAIVWTWKSAQIDSRKVHFVLQEIVGYFLAFIFVHYGLAKLFRTQFYEPMYQWMASPLGEADGFSITWSFFGVSYPYSILIGASQILCSILILFPRTRLLGALILLPIAGNIVFVNYAYSIPVLLNSLVFLIMTAYLVLCEFDRLKAFFWDRGALPAVIPIKWKAKTTYRRRLLRGVLVLGIFGYNLWFYAAFPGYSIEEDTPIAGIWDVQSLEVNGDLKYVRTQPKGWTHMIFERGIAGKYGSLRTGEEETSMMYEVDSLANRVTIMSLISPDNLFEGNYAREAKDRLLLEGVREGITGKDSVRIELKLNKMTNQPILRR